MLHHFQPHAAAEDRVKIPTDLADMTSLILLTFDQTNKVWVPNPCSHAEEQKRP